MLPVVSVCITTYQHKAFIEKAITSVLEQETSFPFDILIGEDGSTDGTAEKVRFFEEKYPNKIQVFYHERASEITQNNSRESMGFASARRNYLNNLKNATGRYIAILDGDDFWIDKLKLESQVKLLEENPELSACFSISKIIDKKGDSTGNFLKPSTNRIKYDLSHLLVKNEFNSPTLIFRREVVESIPEWFYEMPGVFWPTCILCCLAGEVIFIPKVQGAYRIHSHSVHNSLGKHKKLSLSIEGREKLKNVLSPEYHKYLYEGLRLLYWNLTNLEYDKKNDEGLKEVLKKQIALYPQVNFYKFKIIILVLCLKMKLPVLKLINYLRHINTGAKGVLKKAY